MDYSDVAMSVSVAAVSSTAIAMQGSYPSSRRISSLLRRAVQARGTRRTTFFSLTPITRTRHERKPFFKHRLEVCPLHRYRCVIALLQYAIHIQRHTIAFGDRRIVSGGSVYESFPSSRRVTSIKIVRIQVCGSRRGNLPHSHTDSP